MIRLLTQPSPSTIRMKPDCTSSHISTHTSPSPSSPSLKLGQRRKRIMTVQQKGTNISYKNEINSSFKTSEHDRPQQIHQSDQSQLTTIKKPFLHVEISQPQTIRNQAITILSQLPQYFCDSYDLNELERTKVRGIVKLKHKKARSYSPIDKLLKLMEGNGDGRVDFL